MDVPLVRGVQGTLSLRKPRWVSVPGVMSGGTAASGAGVLDAGALETAEEMGSALV